MDNDEHKLSRLMSTMSRLGVSIVATRTHDLNTFLSPKTFEMFDRILLDAPCSGLGVLRRNPDAKWIASKQNLVHFQKKQLRLLENLAYFVKPAGVVVYAVCSTEPEENESVVKLFLNKHSDFAIENNTTEMPPAIRSLVDRHGYLRTWPHLNNMDGFFAACLKRIK